MRMGCGAKGCLRWRRVANRRRRWYHQKKSRSHTTFRQNDRRTVALPFSIFHRVSRATVTTAIPVCYGLEVACRLRLKEASGAGRRRDQRARRVRARRAAPPRRARHARGAAARPGTGHVSHAHAHARLDLGGGGGKVGGFFGKESPSGAIGLDGGVWKLGCATVGAHDHVNPVGKKKRERQRACSRCLISSRAVRSGSPPVLLSRASTNWIVCLWGHPGRWAK